MAEGNLGPALPDPDIFSIRKWKGYLEGGFDWPRIRMFFLEICSSFAWGLLGIW